MNYQKYTRSIPIIQWTGLDLKAKLYWNFSVWHSHGTTTSLLHCSLISPPPPPPSLHGILPLIAGVVVVAVAGGHHPLDGSLVFTQYLLHPRQGGLQSVGPAHRHLHLRHPGKDAVAKKWWSDIVTVLRNILLMMMMKKRERPEDEHQHQCGKEQLADLKQKKQHVLTVAAHKLWLWYVSICFRCESYFPWEKYEFATLHKFERRRNNTNMMLDIKWSW